MKHSTTLFFLLLFSFLLLLSSCVSKKKHLEILAAYDSQLGLLTERLDSSAYVIRQLELEVAERKGENNALLVTQDKMQDRIIALDDEIERLQSESASKVENMDSRLQQRDAIISTKQGKIDALLATLEQRNAAMNQLLLSLQDTLRQLDSTVYDLETTNGQLSLSFQADFLFYSGSTNKTHTAGRLALDNVSHALSLYPTLEVLVIGHTDNSPLRRSSINDKWEFSALRAATVVQLLTQKNELSPNRVTAAGKSEFAPRASNSTPDGRARNERIEIRVFPSQERLIRDLKRALE
ncbi:MAG: OmpA family protein [Phaeodactylibacter sp.]|nr:OmpA family protein [Phaeodactylibacter sp.]MCB9299524.1 OmpA family protein [Lewinellaceae bacterium]